MKISRNTPATLMVIFCVSLLGVAAYLVMNRQGQTSFNPADYTEPGDHGICVRDYYKAYPPDDTNASQAAVKPPCPATN